MTEKGQETLHRWLPVAVMFVSSLITVAVAWGSFSSRVTTLEIQIRDQITRHEYDDLKERMSRIEAKLDAELSRK